MTDFNWCHGPVCHKKHTVDRVRGVKGSKVLRTRRIKYYGNRGWYNYFCSQRCYDDFANEHIQQILAIAPRTDCLETPIHQPTKEQNQYGWSHWEIEVDETRQIN